MANLTQTGKQLTPQDQKMVLAAYVHRFTMDHLPAWAQGTKYPVQFASDQEWLETTYFHVKKNGNLDNRFHPCLSHPTWPQGHR